MATKSRDGGKRRRGRGGGGRESDQSGFKVVTHNRALSLVQDWEDSNQTESTELISNSDRSKQVTLSQLYLFSD